MCIKKPDYLLIECLHVTEIGADENSVNVYTYIVLEIKTTSR